LPKIFISIPGSEKIYKISRRKGGFIVNKIRSGEREPKEK